MTAARREARAPGPERGYAPRMRPTILALVLLTTACSTEAADLNPANDGYVVYSRVGGSFENSRPGEYSSASGTRDKPLLVVALDGRSAGLRVHQTGGGVGAVVAAEGKSDEPALRVSASGRRHAATFSGGSVAVAQDGTLVFESVAKVRAADRIAVERPAAVVVVEAAAGAQRNDVVVPAPAEGQLLWIVNDDDDPARVGEAVVAPGEARTLLYVGGRFRAAATTPPVAADGETRPRGEVPPSTPRAD